MLLNDQELLQAQMMIFCSQICNIEQQLFLLHYGKSNSVLGEDLSPGNETASLHFQYSKWDSKHDKHKTCS